MNSREAFLLNISKLKRNEYLWLLIIIIAGFLIRLWLVDKRWINPDEGAHLMDGKLLLDGLIPIADYGSRQPLYVYIIAMVLNTLGSSYLVGRLIPIVSTLGIILFVFLISKKMFNQKVALLASAIYAFTPFSIFWSTMVHTQPICVLLGCVGIYSVLSYVKSERSHRHRVLLLLGGIFFALSYYVRETSLALLIAIFIYLAVIYRNRIKDFIQSYATVLAGFLFICIGAFLFYSQFLSLFKMLYSRMNPFYHVIDITHKLIPLTRNAISDGKPISTSMVEDFRLEDQPWGSTIWELISTVYFNSFLYIGLVFSVLVLGYVLFIRERDQESGAIAHSITLLYGWVFSLALFYSYWLIYRGFYMQYFEEFLPPLVILLSFVVVYVLSNLGLDRSIWKRVAVVSLFLALVFIVHNQYLQDVGINSVVMGMYVLVVVCVLAVLWFYPELGLRRSVYASVLYLALLGLSLYVLRETQESSYYVRGTMFIALLSLTYITAFIISHVKLKLESMKNNIGFIFISLIVSSFVVSFALSGHRMNMGFSSTWSPEVVEEVSNYIKISSDNDNTEVMSGGVIWEFEADKRPFMNLSHPTALRPGISQGRTQEIETHLNENPPKFIVLDGYTEQTYLRHVKNIKEIMYRKYELKKTINNGSRYPVEIYKLIESNGEISKD